ncbi:gluconolaconase [Aureimonas sp. Leaf454]|uniref:SMP-30/gluconolactonase/LRE family protein n=1 Tax=Aureimonas sp. Leaf454 TaxID=1736381 RepID=UPI000701268E|nr:SMP-30/gluconolactonase/LRE family protein [Aureimonas sp. Leaf454]KQT46330.1 gluconolaconase [Aureimonas sp. Leaf454]
MTSSPPLLRALDAPRCELGEGATYDPRTDTAWWFDILGRTLLEHRFADGTTIVHGLPFMASALARIDQGRQLLATEKGLYVREIATGRLTLHREIEAADDATRSNDARTHPSGAFWMGTMGKHAEEGRGAIYWYRAGEVRRLFGDITITNCICFSPSGDRGYFTDTKKGQILTLALDPATGLPQGEPVAFGSTDLPGHPDGAVTDAEGRLLVARWGGACVSILDTEGRHVRDIALPTGQITCPAFVGTAAASLLVTSAATGYDDEARRADPTAGATFVGEIGVTGRFDPEVRIG